MIIVQDKLVSDDLVEQQFVCNLAACKGACCWEGDYGAPLDEAELAVLDAIYDRVKPFLSPAGIDVIEREGKYLRFEQTDEWVTPLIDNGPCAYMTYDTLGIAKCGIEQAWKAGAVDFQKPVSCHLYPVRVEKNEDLGFEALNYHEWDICSAACSLGKKEKVPVFRFVKDALIRKYGEAFYEELEGAAAFMAQNKAK
ncbi:MAG: DUF3109 family protein [Lewinellaceae bacterium]|nr:DUF3109 family protein [Lewinellaceae bacterium]